MLDKGTAPVALIISLLERISPSRYASLTRCVLYEACSAARQPPLLPTSPTALLGSITHALLERAGRGEFENPERATIENAWDSLVATEEKQMANSPLLRRFVPLRLSARKYEVRRAQACLRSLSIATEVAATGTHVKRVGDTKTYFEKWVCSKDGRVGGYVDYMRETPTELLVRDYKTGSLFEDDKSSVEIKNAYKTQLWLYAALVHETFNRWPTKLELVPLNGVAVEIEFAPEICLSLLESARKTLDRVNSQIQLVMRSKPDALASLGSATPENCLFCPYRPSCAAYWQARSIAPGAHWPMDLRFVVGSVRRFENGRIMIESEPGEGGKTLRLRGFSADEEKYPALPMLTPGTPLAIYNLRPDRLPNTFTETGLTTLYIANPE
jgi:hypothetical protein